MYRKSNRDGERADKEDRINRPLGLGRETCSVYVCVYAWDKLRQRSMRATYVCEQ